MKRNKLTKEEIDKKIMSTIIEKYNLKENEYIIDKCYDNWTINHNLWIDPITKGKFYLETIAIQINNSGEIVKEINFDEGVFRKERYEVLCVIKNNLHRRNLIINPRDYIKEELEFLFS